MISFIVGTKDRPQELKRFIEHLHNQTSKDYEIIVADEGDNEWVKDFNVKYYKQEWKKDWHYSAKNEASKLAQGEYLAFPQDDAEYYPEFVEKMQQGDLCVCGWEYEGKPRNPRPFISEVDIGGFSVKKELFTGFNSNNLADGEFVQSLKDKAVLIKDILYVKR